MIRNFILGLVIAAGLVSSASAQGRCQLQRQAYIEARNEYRYQLRYEKSLDKSVKKGDRNLQKFDYQIERVTARYDRMISNLERQKRFYETNFIVDCGFSGGDACAARLAKFFEKLRQYDYKISNVRDRKSLSLDDMNSRKSLYSQEVDEVRAELARVRAEDLPRTKSAYEAAKAAYESCMNPNGQ